MLAGVTLVDPASTYIEPGVQIGPDTTIWPNTYLQDETIVGEGCEIGPNTILRHTRIGDRCRVLSSLLEGALLEDEVEIGPFARLRKGAHLASHVHMGNFGGKILTWRRVKMVIFLYWRRDHRRKGQHRRRHDHLQL
jgi:bifunctional UDP-N-acetylglucosamine pyrophosphorylase/glucosamine-1-phosphate N-acetyltransferase